MSQSLDTTRWTIILQAADPAAPGSQQALEALCRKYWQPLYAYVRASGKNHEDAQDITQGYFQRLIEKNLPGRVSPDQGRFRAYLLATLRNHMLAWHRDATTQKRGGTDSVHLSIDDDPTLTDALSISPEALYDQRWAQTMVKNALDRLADQQAELGHRDRFALMRSLLLDSEHGEAAQRELITHHGMSEGSIRTAISRLRAQFRQIIREDVSKLVENPAEIDDEIAHLLRALKD
ncbi:MAG: sigma-70 family RNA polymerase sigma factor [Verrucomicrobiaceae bacterium]|nr:sigma-70 family RNA polymerase sigma factor [Verrucomicrobiaceae bacterium]